MIDLFNQNIGAVQAISTILLVIITCYYAWQTRKTVIELYTQRTLGIKPILLPKELCIHDKKAWGGKYSCINCILKNIGRGPALNIYVAIYDADTNKQIAIAQNYIDYLTVDSETDDSHIHIENEMFNRLSFKEKENGVLMAKIKVMLHYDDIYGNTHFSERLFTYKREEGKFSPMIGSFTLESKLIERMRRTHIEKGHFMMGIWSKISRTNTNKLDGKNFAR